MLGDIVMIGDQEEEKSKLNNQEPNINRGFELMLRQHNRRKPELEPKTFQVMFGKMVSLLKREFHFHFEISFDIKKK
jgi:hypothetical protein